MTVLKLDWLTLNYTIITYHTVISLVANYVGDHLARDFSTTCTDDYRTRMVMAKFKDGTEPVQLALKH